MNLDIQAEMGKFFRGYSLTLTERAVIESNPFYIKAMKENDLVKAQQVAIEELEGNAKNKRQQRSMMKKKKNRDEIMRYI